MVHRGLVLAALGLALGSACKKPGPSTPPPDVVSMAEVPEVRCVERPEGCVWCQGRGAPPAFLDEEEDRPVLCDPGDDTECVEFCSHVAPRCALPWLTRGGDRTCVLASEDEFRRAVFWRDNAERPAATFVGRVVDEAGRRIEGAHVRAWVGNTPLVDETSGKDGGFKLTLKAGPWHYAVRVTLRGLATEIADVALTAPDRTEKPAAPRLFRMGDESQVRGKVVGGDGAPVEGVVLHALRTPEDVVESGETESGADGTFVLGGLEAGKRYFVRASRFGWETSTLKAAVLAPARVTVKLARTGVIRGAVADSRGDEEPNATVVAVLSGPLGSAGGTAVLRWTADGDGHFAEDRLARGTYYVWARRGDVVAYPPVKVELTEEAPDAEIKLTLSHRGARVRGKVEGRQGFPLPLGARVVLASRSPLAFPRDATADVRRDGTFSVTGLLPGRHEVSVRSGNQMLSIVHGPRDVDVPIEEGSVVNLPDAIVVRPQTGED